MKRTLLDLTQEILASLSSDEVNSISDTSESLQVASIIRTCYFNIIYRADLPENKQLFQLDPSTDGDKPVLMLKPSNVNRIEWIKYFDNSVNQSDSSVHHIHSLNTDIQQNPTDNLAEEVYKYVTILPLQQFLDFVGSYNVNAEDVGSFQFDIGNSKYVTILYKNDVQPHYCTIVKDQYVIFDSYDNTVDTTLQASKTMCYGLLSPEWRMEDDFIPELDAIEFPLLLNEAKSLAFFELNKTVHQRAERDAKRQWVSLQKHKSLGKDQNFQELPDYGRRLRFYR
jgi:hypothetical protein